MGKENPRFTLEVGVGLQPFPFKGYRKIGEKEHYIGIDNEQMIPNGLVVAKSRLQGVQLWHSGNLDLARADALSMPFRDSSISEVVLCNVFGYSAAQYYLEHIIEEAKRTLEPNGTLTVVETYTPKVTPFTVANETVTQKGFRLLDNPSSVYNPFASMEYQKNQERSKPGGYVAHFAKAA